MTIIHPMDIKQQDIGLLVALDILLAEQNVTRAAKKLGLSQPAMSAQLARLRDLFGDPLLVASGKRMIPTRRANEIREPLRRALTDLNAVVRDMREFDPMSSDRTFRIIATDYVHRIIGTEVMKEISKAAPKVRLAMLLLDTKRTWEALEQDDADLLITSDRLTPSNVKARKLFSESFVFVQRKNHPRGTEPLGLDQFCALDHVLVSPEGGGFVGATDERLERVGRKRRVVASLPSFLVALPLVSCSDLVAVLPRRLAEAMQGELDLFALPFDPPRFDVMLSWHAKHHRDAGHQWLRNLIFGTSA